MLLSWTKDPYALLPCLYNVSFFFVFYLNPKHTTCDYSAAQLFGIKVPLQELFSAQSSG